MVETLSVHRMLHIRNLHLLFGLLSFRGTGGCCQWLKLWVSTGCSTSEIFTCWLDCWVLGGDGAAANDWNFECPPDAPHQKPSHVIWTAEFLGETGLLPMAETLSVYRIIHIKNLHMLIGLLSFRGRRGCCQWLKLLLSTRCSTSETFTGWLDCFVLGGDGAAANCWNF
jgi:hypothetical protein